MEPSQVPTAPKGKKKDRVRPALPPPERPRKLQRALDTIQAYGGIMGVTGAARRYGAEPGNIDYHLYEWSEIECGRVYLQWDVDASKARKEEMGEAAKARREGKGT
jgi:hypothetical protein